jgi:hypothetical protein
MGALSSAPLTWQVVGTGDFNGDGRDDILWRSTSGALSNWLANSDATFTINDSNAFHEVPTSWQVVGTGDFNGDGRDDILWRSSNGALSDWLGTPNGGFTVNDAHALIQVPTDWQIAGTGDFNGDGRDDILWRNSNGALSDWLGTADGGFTVNDANAFTNVPNLWMIIGTGDFNGDGRDDILWQRDFNGDISDWLATANGGFVANDANAYHQVPAIWRVVDVGDYNGDGRDDILWRAATGDVSDWLGTPNGGFANNDSTAYTNQPQTWHSQPPEPYWY